MGARLGEQVTFCMQGSGARPLAHSEHGACPLVVQQLRNFSACGNARARCVHASPLPRHSHCYAPQQNNTPARPTASSSASASDMILASSSISCPLHQISSFQPPLSLRCGGILQCAGRSGVSAVRRPVWRCRRHACTRTVANPASLRRYNYRPPADASAAKSVHPHPRAGMPWHAG